MAWLELVGEMIVIKDLAPGETLRVHPGHVGAFQSSVAFQIHDGAGDQEHDLWRRWDVSGGADGAGTGVAADAADFAAGAPDSASICRGSGRRRRRRAACGGDRGVDTEGDVTERVDFGNGNSSCEVVYADAIWGILEPDRFSGDLFALPQNMERADGLGYWLSPEHTVFVAENEGVVVGSYYVRANQKGGGAHVANAGYMTAGSAAGRGVAQAMRGKFWSRRGRWDFGVMQFNFVVSSNESERCIFAEVWI